MTKTQFEDAQFLSAYPVGVENNYWTIARNRIIKKELESNALKDKKILEIGCGRGIVVDFLQKSGFNCFGVELSDVDSSFPVPPNVISGTDFLSLDEEFSDSIEVVLLLDVIEHLPKDAEFLKLVRSHFKNLKYILITVPARKEIWSNYDVFYGHYRRYDLVQVDSATKEAGFKTKTASYFFHSLYIPGRLLSLLGRKREVQISSPTGFFIFLNKILAFLFWLEFLLLPKNIPGTSIINVSIKN